MSDFFYYIIAVIIKDLEVSYSDYNWTMQSPSELQPDSLDNDISDDNKHLIRMSMCVKQMNLWIDLLFLTDCYFW